jgi:excisionase family DNA binding protein
MEELFELIKAFNRLKEKNVELIGKIDLVLKSSSDPLSGEYLDEGSACKFLHISQSTISRMRKEKLIPYIRQKRKILYRKADLNEYLDRNNRVDLCKIIS